MRQSIARFVRIHPRGSRNALLLATLIMALATTSTAQDAAPLQKKEHTAYYAAYGKNDTEATEVNHGKGTIPVKVSPNPTTGSFKASLCGSKDESVRVEIRDQFGRIIDSLQVSAQAELRFGYWYQPGTYYLHIIQGQNRRKVKLVKLVE